ncbi:Solute carrier family 25 member 40 [Planoprotostelium fungivorum]|uniref:Solute carrier family 25 member 40 n=1 Tax=Planoprotostelium fungivorum TaxID=1890364 RepID=A0A2P6NTW7_9EUKA|nr:Solute carrier family 25 member 40 [Planoprotostelium fungivorum]
MQGMGVENRELQVWKTEQVQKPMMFKSKIMAAGIGSCISAIVVCPFDVVKARLQAQTSSSSLQMNGMIDAFSKITKHEGPVTLWRGLPPTLLMSVPAGAIYFTSYELLKKRLQQNQSNNYMIVAMVAGFGARAVTATITSPLEMLRTNLQATSPQNLKNEGVYQLCRRIVRQNGIRGLWAGLPPTLLRDAPFSAIYWSTFEYSRRQLKDKIETQFFIDFLSGALGGTSSGMIAAGITNPIDLIKTRRQMHLGEGVGRPMGSMQIMEKIWKEEGYKGLTRGMLPRVVKVAPACAIMISCYESCKSYLERFVHGFVKTAMHLTLSFQLTRQSARLSRGRQKAVLLSSFVCHRKEEISLTNSTVYSSSNTTTMRSLSVALLCLLFSSAFGARPSRFESDDLPPADADGVHRKALNLEGRHKRSQVPSQELLQYEVAYNKDVIRLDREHTQIESVECFNGYLRLSVAEGESFPEFEKGKILVGGKEWGCKDEKGQLERFAGRVQETAVYNNKLVVKTIPVEEREVFHKLKMSFKPIRHHFMTAEAATNEDPNDIEWHKKVNWNADESKMKGNASIPLYALTCKSPEAAVQPQLKQACALMNNKVNLELLTLKCSNCFSLFNLDILFDYDSSGSKDLTSIGVSYLQLDVTVGSAVRYSIGLPNLFKLVVPFETMGVPGIADIALQFEIAIDVNLNWEMKGELTSGSFMEGNFSTLSGTHGQNDDRNDFIFRATPSRIKSVAAGNGSLKTTLHAGPHFRVYLFTNSFFNAFAEVTPALSFSVKSDPLGLPATKSPRPNALVQAPWMLEACPKRHLLEWDLSLGVAINVGASGPLVWDYNKALLANSWDIAAGCLLGFNRTLV